MATVDDLTCEDVVRARRLLRSVEEHNRTHKLSNAGVRALWEVWDSVADAVIKLQGVRNASV